MEDIHQTIYAPPPPHLSPPPLALQLITHTKYDQEFKVIVLFYI